jgi:aminomethyltransferase
MSKWGGMILVKLKDPLIYSDNTSPESAVSADQLSEGLQRHKRPRPEKLAEPKTGAGKKGIVDPAKKLVSIIYQRPLRHLFFIQQSIGKIMFERIRPMLTIHDSQTVLQTNDPDLRNPLCQENKVWRVIPPASLVNGFSHNFSRTIDVTGILDDIDRAVGPPTAMCVLGSNVIGAADWEQIPFAKQYRAVTAGAGAFVASNMLYLRISGPDAAAVLNMLTPRNVHKLAPGCAMFVLFTTPAGTVDEEAIVLRTGREEYLVSCGGGKTLSSLPDALKSHPHASVEHSDFVSFNLKGPERIVAMQALVGYEDRPRLASLQPFEACHIQTPDGDSIWVLRTVVGIEMWGSAPVIRMVWDEILNMPALITPCGWNLLNVYRMECSSMVFAVYPLDVHSGTTLWETGYDWMIEKGENEFFIGQEALKQSKSKKRLWLGGLMADNSTQDIPLVGTEVYTRKGEFSGYVTSAAFSIKHERALAFAHLKTEHRPGDTLTINGNQNWLVCSLPFNTG